MKISAVIPAYNSAAFIAEAITSILKQSTPVYEIIVVDDGSSDDTFAVVHGLRGPIRYHKQENCGPAAARNQGIKMAEGEWIAFLDADDQWTSDKIERQLATLTRYPELHLLAGDMSEIDLCNAVLTPSVLAKHGLLSGYIDAQGRPIVNALSKLLHKNFIPTGTVLVKRDTLLAVGLFNEAIHFGEDLELWAKIAAYYPICCMPDLLMLRRLHHHNATHATVSMLIDNIKVMQALRLTIGLPLQQQGLKPERLVADAYTAVAYWHFNLQEYPQARRASLDSLRVALTRRALVYGLLACLPASCLLLLKQVKGFVINLFYSVKVKAQHCKFLIYGFK